MIRSVVVVGPASPAQFGDLLGVDATPGGLGGTAVNELVRGLLSAGVEVSLVTTSYDISAPWSASKGGLHLRVVPGRSNARARARDLFAVERRGLREAIEASVGQVVHAHWTYEFALAALDQSRPAVVTARDAPFTILRHSPDAYRAARTVMALQARRRISTLTAVSPYMAKRWRREMAYRQPILVVPNSTPRDMQFPTNHLRNGEMVLAVADASPRKNVKRLLRAFMLVRQQRPEARLFLAGSGLGPNDPLADWTRRRGLDFAVEFLGAQTRDELAGLYARAAIFVHPSLEESFGNVLLEAMSAGLAVIGGSSSGAVPWILEEGHAGVLVDVRDPSLISSGVLGLLSDTKERDRIAVAGKARAERTFSLDRVVTGYLDAYSSAMSRQIRRLG